MISLRSESDFFSAEFKRRIRFWNLIRTPGVLLQDEEESLQWLIQSCRQKYYGDGEVSYLLTAEDILEHLFRDTLPLCRQDERDF